MTPLILVIEDSDDIRCGFELVLQAAGCRVKTAPNGREGLREMRECRPDLILTDISMPEMNGFEFLVHLRSDFAPPLPPVVVCSGFAVTAEEALRLGAVRFVPKPVASHARPNRETSALEQERAVVQGERARAVAAADRLFARLKAHGPDLDRALPLFAQLVSDYFGIAPAGIVFVDSAGVRVAAVSQGAYVPAGTRLSGGLLFASGLLASGSSLLMGNDAYFGSAADSRAKELGVAFLVAVPLLFDRVPIGAICLFDRAAHDFSAEDLVILEAIGREYSEGLRHSSSLGRDLRYAPSPLFEQMLGAELSLLHRRRGVLELLEVAIDPTVLRPEMALELLNGGGSRMQLSRPDPGTLAFYKRDSSAAAARNAVSVALSTLRSTSGVRGTGWLSVVDNGSAPVPGDVALRLAKVALQQSLSTPEGRMECTSLVGGLALDVQPETNPATTTG